MKTRIFVTLKPGVLDPQGKAIHHALEGLGFTVDNLSITSSVLTVTGGNKRAVAVFLDEGETFEEPATRFDGASPVSNALALADKESLPWVVLTRGRQIRLYAARADTGSLKNHLSVKGTNYGRS